MISKSILRHLMHVGSKNTDIAKIFNACRSLVARFIKCYGLIYFIRDPEDDNEIVQISHEVHQSHKNFGYSCATGHLCTKGIKNTQVRLRIILKNIKKFQANPWIQSYIGHIRVEALA